MPPMPIGPGGIPLDPTEIDDGGVLGTDQQTDEQMDSDTFVSFYKGLIVNSVFIVIVVVVGVVILSFFYRGAPFSGSKKSSNENTNKNQTQREMHDSWESAIDGNHNHRLREQMMPLRMLTTMHNWFNRKKRLFHARRRRRSTRLPNQPKSRAMFYYNNGRAAAASASANSATAGNGNSSSGTHWSAGSGQSRVSGSPTDPETMAALITAQNSNRIPHISLVSNPNYFSEAEQHLLDNSGK